MAKLILCMVILSFTMISTFQAPSLTQAKQVDVFSPLHTLITEDPILEGAIAGVSIRSASNGDLLYSYNGDLSLTPASNLKLFTAASALASLGPDYSFQTELFTDGKVRRNEIKGNVYFVGHGDPTLRVNDIERMAKTLKKQGIQSITGDLIADDSWYDDVRYSVDLPWSDETAYYGAQISALTVSPDKDFDAGTVTIEVSPGQKNQKAEISIFPNTDFVTLINKTNTVSTDEESELTISRTHGKNEVIVEGTISYKALPIKEWVAVWDPTSYSLSVLKKALKQQGIKVKGRERKGVKPNHSKMLLTHQSIPLKEILIPFMKNSNNTHAEMLVKEMGKAHKQSGSWEAGLEVEKQTLTSLGIDVENMYLRDGSGISHVNAIQANSVTDLLYKSQSQAWFSSFYNSLPVAGVKEKKIGGTLRNRMKEEPLKENVVAKTGTLTNVSSISGYLTLSDGNKLIFSILMNHLKDEEQGKLLEEKILSVIAQTTL
ncbi:MULTISPECIES: D-alanyl-D-alanine carboxypeptidase/D-alanyl-D-alanine endopeptidase [Bacillaceae]|uniref:D-alanyl-D-alanine carboxypeptidase/D-alanyl-D-alanine endopeptidase n=1 Tax=Bacillaceae TaxID=186817 RepID=UPI000BFCE97A|nr:MULTISPECIES: D-alanyl-D-alanine carboxypeptidase/D-alanyl-D-alanine-endopeptidase [Bacillaceae]PGT91571.1 D-alanyl-D-alanine carboxypeptidase/D-alanyl-D-alanine-endopeptidase [Bacillus sp. AFS040349]UGB29012.1 D-alanyl-D-alanine carboxypeptidase/D-alanyl-D-alanine-endopeptidase [Metabacillus sp. B2-18]